jgi:DNA-binding NtrC family response regulator/tetratricopeptide (TPR) repeat protein
VLWRAGSRAAVLEARGRHAAASRLLARAARALQGRGETARAAECWLQLAWLARNRGALERAGECARMAAATGASSETQLRAGCLLVLCLTDALRFAEAEASLGDLGSAAETMGCAALRARCQLALARVRLASGHADRALDIEDLTKSEDHEIGCAALGMISRARLAAGDLAASLQAARSALARLPPHAPARLTAASHRVMAEALCQAGDLAQVRLHIDHGLRAATAARLPLHVLKLRAVLVRALRSCGGDRAEADRLTAGIARARLRRLPPLVDRFLASQILPSAAAPAGTGRTHPELRRQIPFETFMDQIHRAPSDLEALGRVLGALCATIDAAAAAAIARDGRVCAAAGRAWRDRCGAANQALTSGQGVPASVERQPPEAAEPIRCGGELLGVIACRWIAGSPVDPVEAADALRAAALSLAAPLRSILDESPPPPPSAWGDLLGESTLAASLRDDIHRAARAPFPVLIEGESGSGKELVARALHRLSARHTRRFCAINCAALSDELLEAELFGHARGAFTGAMTERAGLFEEADAGTLFLDEVGELSARAQAKLLRVLQEGEVRRVGENLPRRVDVRVVAATNRRLEHEAASGRFRADLRFRLDVLRIRVPPLRERVGDIAMLAQHFWKQAAARVGSHATLGPDALAALARYDWPGNVRELQNAIAWMAVHAPRRGRVGAAILPAQLATTPMATGSSFELAREEFERRYVKAALAQAGGHRVAAAKALGISRQGLAKMLRRLGIDEGTEPWRE